MGESSGTGVPVSREDSSRKRHALYPMRVTLEVH